MLNYVNIGYFFQICVVLMYVHRWHPTMVQSFWAEDCELLDLDNKAPQCEMLTHWAKHFSKIHHDDFFFLAKRITSCNFISDVLFIT